MFEPIDYINEALSILSNQYRKPHFETQATIIGAVFNKLQEDLYKVTYLCFLDNATGIQLEILGRIWGVSRGGRTDAELRREINIQSSLLVNGTTDEIENALKYKFGATIANVHTSQIQSEIADGTYSVVTDADITKAELEMISGAGIKVYRSSGNIVSIDDGFDFVRIDDTNINIITISEV